MRAPTRCSSTRFPALAPNVRRRIREEALGNPLALLDLPAALDAGPRPLADTLPLTERLTELYARRLRDLPAGTRELLLFVVLAGAENSMTIENCLPTPEGRADLPPAERAGIVRLNPRTGRMEFRHPLIRSAVFELSTERGTASRARRPRAGVRRRPAAACLASRAIRLSAG